MQLVVELAAFGWNPQFPQRGFPGPLQTIQSITALDGHLAGHESEAVSNNGDRRSLRQR